MSLTMDFPVIETGDIGGQFQSWRIEGVNDVNSDRGRFFVIGGPGAIAGQGRVEVYRNRGRGSSDLVLTGEGPISSSSGSTRIDLAPVGTDPNILTLVASVVMTSSVVSSLAEVWTALAGDTDITRRASQIKNLFLKEAGETDFSEIRRAVMREFLVEVQDRVSTPQIQGDPLRLPEAAPLIQQTRHGLPEFNATFMWTLNLEGDWELTGLQNPGDWREWAISKSLELIWERVVRQGETDPRFQTVLRHQRNASKLRKKLTFELDANRDRRPDRKIRLRTARVRRG